MDPLLAGLPAAVADALAQPPEQEWALLELGVEPPELQDAQARVAARLRMFVLTRDPLDRLDRMDPAWATANGDGDDYEVVVYVPLGNALTLAAWDRSTVRDVLAALAESAIVVGAAHEQLVLTGAYAQAAARGRAPSLLGDPDADLPRARASRRLTSPAIGLVSDGWEPVGLGAVQDLVQARFGPVDLDRTTVHLTPRDTAASGCPACAGTGFGFPADLQEHIPALCPPHAGEANRVTSRRLARAARSNRRGWDAIAVGSQRLQEPPPPWGLCRRLRAALEQSPTDGADRHARTVADAQLILDLARHYGDQAAPFDDLLEGDEDLAWRLMDWLTTTLFGLGRAGRGDLVVPVGEALARIDPDNAALHTSDLAVALADQGEVEAVAYAEGNVRAHPEDLWARIHLGDVHRRLGDLARAETVYREVVAWAREHAEPPDVDAAYERLTELLAAQGRSQEVGALDEERTRAVSRRRARQRSRRRAPRSAAETTPAADDIAAVPHPPVRRAGPKVGRNDPCPCGSGRKYKRCHGT